MLELFMWLGDDEGSAAEPSFDQAIPLTSFSLQLEPRPAANAEPAYPLALSVTKEADAFSAELLYLCALQERIPQIAIFTADRRGRAPLTAAYRLVLHDGVITSVCSAGTSFDDPVQESMTLRGRRLRIDHKGTSAEFSLGD